MDSSSEVEDLTQDLHANNDTKNRSEVDSSNEFSEKELKC